MINKSYSTGWQVFRVKSAVRDWISGLTSSTMTSSTTNMGLAVVALSALGHPVAVRLSRRCDRDANQQPVLVLFNDDPSTGSYPTIVPHNVNGIVNQIFSWNYLQLNQNSILIIKIHRYYWILFILIHIKI